MCPIEVGDAANFRIGESGLISLRALTEDAEHPSLGGFSVDAAVLPQGSKQDKPVVQLSSLPVFFA
ncbi:MAG: hypothetical protein K6360_05690 [Deltaproteobacteria bacterium]